MVMSHLLHTLLADDEIFASQHLTNDPLSSEGIIRHNAHDFVRWISKDRTQRIERARSCCVKRKILAPNHQISGQSPRFVIIDGDDCTEA